MAVVDEIKILVKAEVDAAVKSLDKAEKSSDKLWDSFKKLQSVMQGPVAAAKDVANGLGKVVDVAMDLYKEFGEAELAAIKLNAAIANSSNLSSGAEGRLSAFADELQSFSIFEGDATKAIIANLVALGKSETQIKEMVSAAADLASATGVDLDTAITQLNATLQGNAGILGRQNSAVKALTEEQLKNGDAIKIISAQYGGFAEKVGKSALGSIEQLTNNFGDLKETVGELVKTSFQPLLQGLNDVVTATNDSLVAGKAREKLRKGEALSLNEALILEKQLKQEVLDGNTQYGIRGTMALKDLDLVQRIKGGLMTQAVLDEAALKRKQEQLKAEEALNKSREEAAKKREEEAKKGVNWEAFALEWKYKGLGVTEETLEYEERTVKKSESMLSVLAKKLAISEDNADALARTSAEVEKWADSADGVEYILRNIAVGIEGNTDKAKQFGEALSDGWSQAIGVAEAYADLVQNQQDIELSEKQEQNDAYIAGLEKEVEKYEDGSDAKESAEKKLNDEKARLAEEEKSIKNKYGKEAFDGKKALSIAEITINGAVAAVKALSELGPVAGPIAGAVIAGLTGAQIGLVAGQEYVPMAQGGIITSPTRILAGENGAEAIIPLRGNNAGLGRNVTIVQNIGGSIVTEKYLTKKAMQAMAYASRGY